MLSLIIIWNLICKKGRKKNYMFVPFHITCWMVKFCELWGFVHPFLWFSCQPNRGFELHSIIFLLTLLLLKSCKLISFHWAGLKGILREAKSRGRKQLDRAPTARSRSCTTDYVHDCNVGYVACWWECIEFYVWFSIMNKN